MIDPQIKARWLEELRSGKHEQARRNYKTGDGKLCCLGVLGEVVLEGQKDEKFWKVVPDYGELVVRNDGLEGHHPHSFLEIANWIEANL